MEEREKAGIELNSSFTALPKTPPPDTPQEVSHNHEGDTLIYG
jgi:hypothetical protein